MSLTAKTVVKDKFWIVEKDGIKTATIQKYIDGEASITVRGETDRYKTIQQLARAYDIKFVKADKKQEEKEQGVYGYPCNGRSYNCLFNVQKQLPMFTRTKKSKSYFVAGYYVVQSKKALNVSYCPKLITVERNIFRGPFKTRLEANDAMRKWTNE